MRDQIGVEPTESYKNPEITAAFRVLQEKIIELLQTIHASGDGIENKNAVIATFNEVKSLFQDEDIPDDVNDLFHMLKGVISDINTLPEGSRDTPLEQFNFKRSLARERIQKQYNALKKEVDVSHMPLARFEDNRLRSREQSPDQLFKDVKQLALESDILDLEDASHMIASYLQMNGQMDEAVKKKLFVLQSMLELYREIESTVTENDIV